MSTIIIVTKERVAVVLRDYTEEISSGLISSTSDALNRNPKDVIVDYQRWGIPESENAPDVLIRAETSLPRRHLLKPWGESLLESWKSTITNLNLTFDPPLRVAIKPYVIDSEWIEDSNTK